MSYNVFINDQEKGENNEMWNLYSVENHLAQRGPKEGAEGLLLQLQTTKYNAQKMHSNFYTERNSVKS